MFNMFKTFRLFVILLLSFDLSAYNAPDTYKEYEHRTKLKYLFKREHIDKDQKSLIGWIRTFNNESKTKYYNFNTKELKIIINTLKEEYNKEKIKRTRSIK